MQMNFESAAMPQTLVNLSKARRNEHRRSVRGALPVIGWAQSRKSEALENVLWTALALSAIWALVVSVGF